VVCSAKTPPLLEATWSAEEELLLLNAIELNGFGNWSEICQIVKTKTPPECEWHYIECYVNSLSAPRPVLRVHDPFPIPGPPTYPTNATESCPSDGHDKNLFFANKKERTTPAEVNGWMPKRGEFEEEYNDDADHIIDGIEFDEETDTDESFTQKINALLCFDWQLQERRERTRVVQEWKLHTGNWDGWQKLLTGVTGPEKELDARILTLAPYIGRRNTEVLATGLHQLSRQIQIIETRQRWQRQGVQLLKEGFLFSYLEAIVKDGRVPESEFGRWNEHISEYLRDHGKRETEDAKLLSEREAEMCKAEEIPPPMFVALKDLLIREFAARGGLSREEALELAPDEAHLVGLIYDLFVSVGWITN
jgi:transcriptional adapter 2-alpha